MNIQTCPNCEAELSESEEAAFWCESCEWKSDSSDAEKSESVFQKIYFSLSRKYGAALYNSLIETRPEKLKPRMTLSKSCAFAISAVVYLPTFLLPVFAVWILIVGWSNIFALILGVTSLLISWAIRPRIPNIPKGVLPKEEFPALYEFTDSIADSLNAKRVDGIIISGDLNAAFGQYGIGSKKIIHIGLPLWEILSIEEKGALIAHELSHGINGDPLRGLFIENALQSLLNWFVILRPSGFWEPEKGVLGILILPLNLLLWIPAGFVLFMAYLLAYLIYADSQRSEYFADYLATRACGTEAMVSLLEKSLIAGKRFEMILHKVFFGRKAGDLFEELAKDIFSLSQEEKEKIKKIGQLEKSRLDATHPPTFYRTQFLKHHFEAGTLILPGVDKIALLEREMSILKSDAQAEIINIYEATLYY